MESLFKHQVNGIKHQINWKVDTSSRGIQNPSANRQVIFLKQPASVARILCAKKQPSHRLLHADWLMLYNTSNQSGANSVMDAPWHMKSFESCIPQELFGG